MPVSRVHFTLNVGRHIYPTAECLEQTVYAQKACNFLFLNPTDVEINENGIIVALCIHFVVNASAIFWLLFTGTHGSV